MSGIERLLQCYVKVGADIEEVLSYVKLSAGVKWALSYIKIKVCHQKNSSELHKSRF